MSIESVITPRRAPSVQEILATGKNPPPDIVRMESPRDRSLDDVSLDRHHAKVWHDREVETVWRKTWQTACRVEDIPEVGDAEICEIVHDSLVIVRTGRGGNDIRAYVNACLQCGTILCAEGGHPGHIKFPAHGLTGNLQGGLAGQPCAWNFPQIDRARFNLLKAHMTK